jgi:hypothetical protein
MRSFIFLAIFFLYSREKIKICPEANEMDNKQKGKKGESQRQHIVATLNVKIKNLLIKKYTYKYIGRQGNPFKLKLDGRF